MLTNLTFTARRVFTPTLLFKAAACLALLLCMAWFGRLHFYRDPGSVFFDKDRAYETHYSAHRRVEAQQFIDAYVNGTKSYVNGTSQFANNDSGSNKSLCVALSSVKRQTQYLEVKRCLPLRHLIRVLTALNKHRPPSERFYMA